MQVMNNETVIEYNYQKLAVTMLFNKHLKLEFVGKLFKV